MWSEEGKDSFNSAVISKNNDDGCLPEGQIEVFSFSHSEKLYSIIPELTDIYVRFIDALWFFQSILIILCNSCLKDHSFQNFSNISHLRKIEELFFEQTPTDVLYLLAALLYIDNRLKLKKKWCRPYTQPEPPKL